MPRVFITTQESDTELAQKLAADLGARLLPRPDAVSSADALLILVNQAEFTADSTFHQVMETGLQRTDLFMMVVLVNDKPLPALSPQLQGLAYIPAAVVCTDVAFYQRDVRRLKQQLESFFVRKARLDSKGRIPWNVLIFAGLFALGIVLILVANPRMQSATGVETILVGVAAPFKDTQHGDLVLEGINQALADRSLEIEGQAFEASLVVQDTRCSSRGGLETAQLFTADEAIVGVIGHMCNSSCQAAATIYDSAGLTTISPGCDAPGLTRSGLTSFNRTVPSQAYTAWASAEFVFEMLGIQQVLVVHDEQIVGGQLASTFVERFNELGGKVLDFIIVESMSLSMAELVEQISRHAPQLIFYAGRTSTAANLKTEFPDTSFVLGDIVEAEEYIDLAGNAADQSYFLKRRLPDKAERTYGYNALVMLLDAVAMTSTLMEDGGIAVDRKLLGNYVRAYNGCDGNGNCAVAEIDVFVVIDQRLTPHVGE